MKYLIVSLTFIFLVVSMATFVLSGDQPSVSKDVAKSQATAAVEAERVYPIAPGVWYPGRGPIPEKPIRYYRVRCWPGCHSGSDYGKYPDRPLHMKPIHPTSPLRHQKGTYVP